MDTAFLVDLGKVSPEMAAALGLNGEFLSTVTNGTIKMGDVMRILQRTLGCSGRYCVDLAQVGASRALLRSYPCSSPSVFREGPHTNQA